MIPYFGYARQDRRPRSARVPISAKVVADMLAVAGINRVLTVDLHADQIQGFFNVPVDNVYASPVLVDHVRRAEYPQPDGRYRRTSAASRARARSPNRSTTPIWRSSTSAGRWPNESEVMNVIGDVEGRTCIMIDDIVDTAGTLCQAAAALKDHGAAGVVAYITHAVLSGPAIERINDSALDAMYVTDTIPLVRAGKGLHADYPVEPGPAAGRGDSPGQQRRVGQRDVPLRFTTSFQRCARVLVADPLRFLNVTTRR